MAAKTKIKISDDMELRKVLDDEYENSSQIKLCRYALLLAEHILKTIDYHDADSLAIKAGFEIGRAHV